MVKILRKVFKIYFFFTGMGYRHGHRDHRDPNHRDGRRPPLLQDKKTSFPQFAHVQRVRRGYGGPQRYLGPPLGRA